MDRKTVLLDEAQLERQREYTRQLAALHQQRGKPVYALVDTFGCQQNVADSQHILGMLRDMGCQFTDDAAQADIVVLNTCAIRDHAEKRVYGNLGALTHTKKQNPEQVICLCGCMAQRPEVAEKVRQSYRHVDLVFGPQALWKFPELLYQVYTRRGRVFSVEDEHGTIAEGMPVVREGNVRAWVSIMYGCNNFCSYCIVPYVRGRERSREPQCIIDDMRQLAAEGYKEITLLGQNVNSYGKDLETPWDFADLLQELDKIEGDYLIRFMSSQPKDATPKLFDTMARSRHVAHQLHLPVQSGCDRVLRAMNRPYDRARYLELITYARKVMPDLVLTSDVIIGFPGETEAEAMRRWSWCGRWNSTPCSPSSSLPGPVRRRPKWTIPSPAARSRSGSTPSAPCRTISLPGSTPDMWARPCVCWWTAAPTTRAGPCPPGRREDGWYIWWATRPLWASTGRYALPTATPGRCSGKWYDPPPVNGRVEEFSTCQPGVLHFSTGFSTKFDRFHLFLAERGMRVWQK